MKLSLFNGKSFLLLCLFMMLTAGSAVAEDWASWRGKYQNGVSDETNLISSWSQDGENLIWKQDFIGRSTPIIMNGRVYVIGRTGEGVSIQERVACFDAENGTLLWEHLYTVRNTYAPFSRTGWACMVGDPETGNVYSIGTAGILNCFDKDGNILWWRSMIEDFSVRTGYGGRTTNPVIDEDRVIITFVSAGWGDQKPMKGRHFAFNKHNGDVVWMSTPGGVFKIPNLYSNPVIKVLDGQRLMIAGTADGHVYAIKSRTGEKVWGFHLSQRGLNSSVVVENGIVYAGHSEENIDAPHMGRITAFKASGSGDITKTNEIWRVEAEIGFTSPLYHDGRVYYIDNASNMFCLNAETGEEHWRYSLGTVGKGSPVWADGKIYVTETNGRFLILEPRDTECVLLSEQQIHMPEGRTAEIYSSPAIAYGRIFFTTEEGIYCLGDKGAPYEVSSPSALVVGEEPSVENDQTPAHVQVYPAEVVLWPNEKVAFKARLFNKRGQFLQESDAEWSFKNMQVNGEEAKIEENGTLSTDAGTGFHAGIISAKVGDLEGTARVRIFAALPWEEDFSAYEDDKNPPWWMGTSVVQSPGGKFIIKTLEDGNKVLSKPRNVKGIQRHFAFIGTRDMSNYTVQVDVKDAYHKRRRGDAGIISHGYTLDLMGKTQRIEIRAWTSENRIRERVDFAWDAETWHTVKMRVDIVDGKAIIKGKVWKTGEAEPADWMIQAEDPYPATVGSPALYGVSNTEVNFDNLKVWQNE